LALYLKDPSVQASFIAGDMNAIEQFDRILHSDNGLHDVYLELGGKEDCDQGYTWGQQAPKALREQFGYSRMDKVLFQGALKPVSLARIGEGVQVEDEEARKAILDAGGEVWASDHLGLSVLFEVGDATTKSVI
jgi:tyrosyl-DNA phosphodiesterase 2